jgi:hypothetical protein
VTDGPDARADGGRGVYLYGIVPAGVAPERTAPGVDRRFSPFLLEHVGVAAIVSEVSLDDFGEEALRENLNRLPWLEACARAHEEVLEHALEAGAVLPARLATVYASERHVRLLLEREHDAFLTQLEALRDKREWGVKGFVDDEQLTRWLETSDKELTGLRTSEGPTTEGAAYLARRQYDMLVRSRVGDAKVRLAEAIHSALARHAERAQLNPTHRSALVPEDGELVVNGAYLVARAAEDAFLSAVREFDDAQRSRGVRLDLTGPWPPYNFVTAVGGAG